MRALTAAEQAALSELLGGESAPDARGIDALRKALAALTT